MPQVVGYVGENGAGKSSFCEAVTECVRRDGFTVGKLGFSEPLRETFARLNEEYSAGYLPGHVAVADILEQSWCIESTLVNREKFIRHVIPHFEKPGMCTIDIDRPNLQLLAQVMQMAHVFEEGVLSRAVFGRVSRYTQHLINADGMRWPSDEVELRKDPKGLLVYVTAPEEVRFARMRRRARDGEDVKTDEQFRREEQALNEVYIPTMGKNADPGCTIVNDTDDPRDLQAKVEAFYANTLRPRLLALR